MVMEMEQEMRAAPERSELQDIIVYFTYKMPYLTEIRLNKLIYAAEIYCIEKFGKRLTDIPFMRYHYGPWSPRIGAEGAVISGTDIRIESRRTPDGHESTFFVPIEDKKMSVNILEEKIPVLDDVVEDWRFKSTEELIEFTKSTIPYRRSKFGEVLDLDRHARLMKLVHDKEIIEAVERSRREAKEGKGRTFVNKEELERYYDAL